VRGLLDQLPDDGVEALMDFLAAALAEEIETERQKETPATVSAATGVNSNVGENERGKYLASRADSKAY